MQIKKDSTAEKNSSKNTKIESKLDESNSTTKTVVKYKPEIDPATGKAKPFKMQTTRNGSVNGSIEVDGNGEVTVENVSSESSKAESENKEEITALTERFSAKFEILEKKQTELESTIKTQNSSILRLYIIIIVLAILLVVSLYFNFRKRVRIV